MNIETERLMIRPIEDSDIGALLVVYNSQENMRYISTGKYMWTKSELTNKYNKLQVKHAKDFGICAVILKKTNVVIGEAGFFDSFNSLNDLELGYIIDCQYWGQGLGSELVEALIHYGFTKITLTSITARMYANNKASVALAQKCAMAKYDEVLTQDDNLFYVYKIFNPKMMGYK